MVYNNLESEEKATINGEIISNDVKQIMNHIRHLPFNIGSATLKEDNGIDDLLRYCDGMIEKGKQESFIDELFKAIQDYYIGIEVVRSDTRTFSFSWNNPSRDEMFETLKNSELLGMVGLYMKSKNIRDCRDSMIEKLGVLAYYNRGMGQFVDFYDSHIAMLADCAALDLERIAEQLRV